MSETKKKLPIHYWYWPERGGNGTFEIEPGILVQMMEHMRELGAGTERDKVKVKGKSNGEVNEGGSNQHP